MSILKSLTSISKISKSSNDSLLYINKETSTNLQNENYINNYDSKWSPNFKIVGRGGKNVIAA